MEARTADQLDTNSEMDGQLESSNGAPDASPDIPGSHEPTCGADFPRAEIDGDSDAVDRWPPRNARVLGTHHGSDLGYDRDQRRPPRCHRVAYGLTPRRSGALRSGQPDNERPSSNDSEGGANGIQLARCPLYCTTWREPCHGVSSAVGQSTAFTLGVGTCKLSVQNGDDSAPPWCHAGLGSAPYGRGKLSQLHRRPLRHD